VITVIGGRHECFKKSKFFVEFSVQQGGYKKRHYQEFYWFMALKICLRNSGVKKQPPIVLILHQGLPVVKKG
jgi:hypothetical protein